MPCTRRDCLSLLAPSTLRAQELADRIAQTIRAYEQQGNHRTGTAVDRLSGGWLASEVRRTGLTPAREVFPISRLDPIAGSLTLGDRRIEGLPLFDGGFTDAKGVTGRLGPLGTDAPIALAEGPPNGTGNGRDALTLTSDARPKTIGEARQQNRHQAIVYVTRGGRPGLCPSNAEHFLRPFGPPVLQVSSEEADVLTAAAKRGAEVTVVAHVKRTPAEAFNVITTIRGTGRALAPLVIMTPRSGWWTCASERGGGIACWLELMRGLREKRPARDVHFVASTGHEIGYRGIEVFTERRPRLIQRGHAWIHLGANLGAAQQPGTILQASSDEMEATLAGALAKAGLAINRKIPRGTMAAGEAGVVHRGGGRYVSLIGGNALFHHPADRGPDAIDPAMIARFVAVLTSVARTLTAA